MTTTTSQTATEIEEADRAADEGLTRCIYFLSTTARRWWQCCKSQTPNVITMIGYAHFKGAPLHYICYASDARKFSRAIRIEHKTIELGDFAIPVLHFYHDELQAYTNQLAAAGIELITW